MTDKISPEQRSKNMSAIKGRDTKLELQVRKHLFKLGYRYRINYKLTGKPDIVFVSRRIAIFIHGCFWHQHGCKLSTKPKSNSDFWTKKLEGNKERDIKVEQILTKEGWKVLTIWECDIEKDIYSTVTKITDYLINK